MIKSFLQALPLDVMSCLKIPVTICSLLEKKSENSIGDELKWTGKSIESAGTNCVIGRLKGLWD